LPSTDHELMFDKYLSDVETGKITSGNFLKQAVKRHRKDLIRSKVKSFPYVFKPEIAEDYLVFIEHLPHIKGEWARLRMTLKLEPWEIFILTMIFGWVRKDNGLRRFQRVFIEVARKNGKTFLAAAVAEAIFFLDNEPGAEIYIAATKKDQAKLCWDVIDAQIQKVPALAKKVQPFYSTFKIVNMATSSFIKPLGADSNTEDGLNPSVAIIDEYHAHPTNQMLEVLESGMAARANHLTFIITTAGTHREYPCYTEERENAKQILSGTMEADKSLCILYELDEGDDWTDEANAIKANPNYGVSIYKDFVQGRIEEALQSPMKQSLIRTKNFNQWVDSPSVWISDDVWQKCRRPIDLEDYRGREFTFGVDLSDKIDLSSVSLIFPPKDLETEKAVFARFFMPADKVDEKTKMDHVSYAAWRDAGWIYCTPGNTVDQEYIENWLLNLIDEYDLKPISGAYDPWNAQQITRHWQDDGIEMVEFRQGYRTMSPACKDFEKDVLDGKIIHDGSPILQWNLSCVELDMDPAGNIKISKQKIAKSSKRVDGVIATVMANALLMAPEDDSGEGNIYVMTS